MTSLARIWIISGFVYTRTHAYRGILVSALLLRVVHSVDAFLSRLNVLSLVPFPYFSPSPLPQFGFLALRRSFASFLSSSSLCRASPSAFPTSNPPPPPPPPPPPHRHHRGPPLLPPFALYEHVVILEILMHILFCDEKITFKKSALPLALRNAKYFCCIFFKTWLKFLVILKIFIMSDSSRLYHVYISMWMRQERERERYLRERERSLYTIYTNFVFKIDMKVFLRCHVYVRYTEIWRIVNKIS